MKLFSLGRHFFISCFLVSIACFVGISPAYSADSVMGKKIFRRCSACHFADREKNKIGPYLKDVLGRQAGTVPNYTYSKAMIEAGKKGLIWNKDILKKYLHSPHTVVKGTKMFGVNLKSDSDIDDLIAYLKSVSSAGDTNTPNTK